jgi:hypothetical protein
MRWDALFEDLESQFEALQDGDLYGEVAERIRAEVGKITLLDRLRGAVGTVIRVELTHADPVQGELVRVGKDCLLIEGERFEEWLIPVAALTAVHRLGPWADPAVGAVEAKLGLAHLLRGIARDRSPVTLFVAGPGGDPVTGTPTSWRSRSTRSTRLAGEARSSTSAWCLPRLCQPSAAADTEVSR